MRTFLFTKLSTDFTTLGKQFIAVVLLLCGPLASVTLIAKESVHYANPKALVSAAQRGEPFAQLDLGSAYDNGAGGFPLDPVQAVSWYRRAADQGLAEAQFNLAHCLVSGNGVARDDAAALQWMLRAAEQHLASAQYLVGVMYAEGVGTPVDREQGLAWLAKAASNGNHDAALLMQRLQHQGGTQTAIPQ